MNTSKTTINNEYSKQYLMKTTAPERGSGPRRADLDGGLLPRQDYRKPGVDSCDICCIN